MIELLSIQPISNVVAIEFNYAEPETLVANYWFPKFVAIYSSNISDSRRDINLHQIYLRTGACDPTVVQFDEDATSESKVKDGYLKRGHDIVAFSYLNENNFRLLFSCYQRRNNADFVDEYEQQQINAKNAAKDIRNLIEELRGNGIALHSDIEEIAKNIVSELNKSDEFYR